jgi:homoaconitase/3-isopropylmalate dehydratase large subunit
VRASRAAARGAETSLEYVGNMALNKYLKNMGLKGRKFIACPGSRNITGICWKYGVEQIFKEYGFEGTQIYSLPGTPTCLGPVLYIPSDKC